MSDEEVVLCFGEKSGLRGDVGRDPHSILLTDQRIIKLARSDRNLEVTFISLKDAHVVEVKDTSRGIKPLLRVGLLAAGAAAALLVVTAYVLAWALAIVLGLGSLYNLIRYIRSVEDGSLIIRGGQNEVGIPFRHGLAAQAYAFVDRFFEVKSSPPTTEEEGAQEEVQPDAPGTEVLVDSKGEDERCYQEAGEWEPPLPVPWGSISEGHAEELEAGLGEASTWSDAPSPWEYTTEQGPDLDSEDDSQRDAT